jgi:hypothetical protein
VWKAVIIVIIIVVNVIITTTVMTSEERNSSYVLNNKWYIFPTFLEVFTAVTMTNAVLWDATQCGFCKNRSFGERIASIIRVKGISELETTLAVTSN